MNAEEAKLHKRFERDLYRSGGKRRIRPAPISKLRIVEKRDEPSALDLLLAASTKDNDMIGPEAGQRKRKH